MKYKFQYMSLTELGQLFYKDNKSPICASSHDVGRWLISIGLRDGNKLPSHRSLSEGFVIQKCSGPQGNIPNYYWDSVRTIEELEKGGYKRLPNPPQNLIRHGKADGPYVYIWSDNLNGYNIKSSSGLIAATVYDCENAMEITRILNMYDLFEKKNEWNDTMSKNEKDCAENMLDKEDEYRSEYREKHVPVGFIKRIEPLSKEIERCMEKQDFECANDLLEEGIGMIQNEIRDDYCVGVLAAYLIASAHYCFAIEGVQRAYDLFGSTWESLVKEGDTILLNSWVFWCNNITIQRSLYAEY